MMISGASVALDQLGAQRRLLVVIDEPLGRAAASFDGCLDIDELAVGERSLRREECSLRAERKGEFSESRDLAGSCSPGCG